MNIVLSVLTYALLPMAATVLGAATAAFRPPQPKLRSVIQHFAAGVVFSVVAVELLPDIVRSHTRASAFDTAVGFALGVGAMLLLRSLADVSGAGQVIGGGKLPTTMLAAIGIDILTDGFLIGIGFAAGAKEGKLLTLALTVELLSLGLATAVALGETGVSRAKNILTNGALASLIVVGAVAGAVLLSRLSANALEVVLAFGLAALLFLVTEELLVEAHEVPETPLTTATFFAGFLLFLILGMVG